TATGGGKADRARRIGAERGKTEASRRRHAGAARRHTCPIVRAPWIDRRDNGGVMMAGRAFGELKLAENDRARLPQTFDDSGVIGGCPVAVDGRSRSRRRILREAEILDRDGNAMKGAAIETVADFAFGAARLRQRAAGHERSIGMQARLKPGDAVELIL